MPLVDIETIEVAAGHEMTRAATSQAEMQIFARGWLCHDCGGSDASFLGVQLDEQEHVVRLTWLCPGCAPKHRADGFRLTDKGREATKGALPS
ncbi:MAG: hypothetical protein KGJ86_10240 [Chloroflexota bacterium]|nr:hypothetical protein [Chloroflexota bacterium]